MRVLAVVLIVLALALAGCSGGGDDKSPSASSSSTKSSSSNPGTSSSSASTSGSSSSSSSPGPAPNRAPTGAVLAALNGTMVTFNLTGSDPDGNALSWSLSFGDGAANATGNTLPDVVTHTYAVGLYNVSLTITDGKLAFRTTLDLNVSASAPFVVLTGTTAQPCDLCSGFGIVGPVGVPGLGGKACASFMSAQAGGDCVWFPLPAGAPGRAFTSTSSGGDPDLEFATTCERTYESGGFSFVVGNEAGTVPADVACVIIWEYEAEASTHVFTVL